MIITTNDLGKRFNREWIFRKLSWQFHAGVVYAVTGPNGSGKSTLLSVLSGHVPQTNGTIAYTSAKQQVVAVDDIYRHLSFAAPYLELIEDFTVEEHLAFHFRLKPIRPGYSIPQILEVAYLENARNKLVYNLSSGMKQRLKLALSFYADSSILLLDEPATNLDSKAFEWYGTELGKISPGTLVIIASNNPSEYPSNSEILNLLDFKI